MDSVHHRWILEYALTKPEVDVQTIHFLLTKAKTCLKPKDLKVEFLLVLRSLEVEVSAIGTGVTGPTGIRMQHIERCLMQLDELASKDTWNTADLRSQDIARLTASHLNPAVLKPPEHLVVQVQIQSVLSHLRPDAFDWEACSLALDEYFNDSESQSPTQGGTDATAALVSEFCDELGAVRASEAVSTSSSIAAVLDAHPCDATLKDLMTYIKQTKTTLGPAFLEIVERDMASGQYTFDAFHKFPHDRLQPARPCAISSLFHPLEGRSRAPPSGPSQRSASRGRGAAGAGAGPEEPAEEEGSSQRGEAEDPWTASLLTPPTVKMASQATSSGTPQGGEAADGEVPLPGAALESPPQLRLKTQEGYLGDLELHNMLEIGEPCIELLPDRLTLSFTAVNKDNDRLEFAFAVDEADIVAIHAVCGDPDVLDRHPDPKNPPILAVHFCYEAVEARYPNCKPIWWRSSPHHNLVLKMLSHKQVKDLTDTVGEVSTTLRSKWDFVPHTESWKENLKLLTRAAHQHHRLHIAGATPPRRAVPSADDAAPSAPAGPAQAGGAEAGGASSPAARTPELDSPALEAPQPRRRLRRAASVLREDAPQADQPADEQEPAAGAPELPAAEQVHDGEAAVGEPSPAQGESPGTAHSPGHGAAAAAAAAGAGTPPPGGAAGRSPLQGRTGQRRSARVTMQAEVRYSEEVIGELQQRSSALRSLGQDPLGAALTAAAEAQARLGPPAPAASPDLADQPGADQPGPSVNERKRKATRVSWTSQDDRLESPRDEIEVSGDEEAGDPQQRLPARLPAVAVPLPSPLQPTRVGRVSQVQDGSASEGGPAKVRRAIVRWSAEEAEAFKSLVRQHGSSNWKLILDRGQTNGILRECRTEVDLKDKWRNLQRAEERARGER